MTLVNSTWCANRGSIWKWAVALSVIFACFGMSGCASVVSERASSAASAADTCCAQSIDHAREDIQIMYCWGVGGRNRLDTITGTITKDLVSAGSITVPFELSLERRQMIVDYADSIGFWKLPGRIVLPDTVDLVKMHSPHSEHILIIWEGWRQKSVAWDTSIGNPIAERDRVTPLGAMIRRFVVESEVFQALPKHQGGYM